MARATASDEAPAAAAGVPAGSPLSLREAMFSCDAIYFSPSAPTFVMTV